MIVRDLIKELLEFNLDAEINIRTEYCDSEGVNISWLSDDCDSISESKASTSFVFLESDYLQEDSENIFEK